MSKSTNDLRSVFSDLNIEYSDKLEKDIAKSIKGSGVEKEFFMQLTTRLVQLSKFRSNAHIYSKDFEKLSGQDLYAMKITPRNLNFRILYAIEDNIIVLHGFLEKKTGTDYKGSIKIAKNRLKLMKGEL